MTCMRFFQAVLLALVVLLSSCSYVFVNNHHTDYQIVIENGQNPHQMRAAALLTDYVWKMTGVELRTADSESENPRKAIRFETDSSLHPDGYQISMDNSQLRISGGSHKGCIYGVIYLLEQEWGCRKYSTAFGIVPEKSRLTFPRGTITDYPKNDYRIINGRFSLDPDYQDWQATDVVQDQFADRYYVHTFNRLLPWEAYYANHPEYYAEVNGKRIPEQLCLTHPDVLKLTIQKLREEMKLQPDRVLWSVSQNDNPSYCQCATCRELDQKEGAPSGSLIHFVNAVAREFPDHIISTLAYQYSRQAPRYVKPESNVQIMLCTIELNRSEPIAEDPRSAGFLSDLEDWGKISDHLYLWDYTVNFSHHISPFPNYHVLQPNIQLFYENGVKEHFQQSNTDTGHEFSELKSYLISHLLWDPYCSVDSLTDEFMSGYYGAAAQKVRAYFDGLQADILETGEWLDIYGHPTAHQGTFLSDEKVSQYLDWFQEARQLVAEDSARLIHVRTAELPLQYAAMEIGISRMFDSRGWYTEENGVFVPNQEMFDMMEDFIETCRLAGVRTINESGLTPEAYYQVVRRAVDVSIEGNLAFRKSVSAFPLPASKYAGGDLASLTDGVKGATDFQASWLGWEAQDFTLTLDLEEVVVAKKVVISSLFRQNSWIFHPKSLTCMISVDGAIFHEIGTETNDPEIRMHPVAREHVFHPDQAFRYVRFDVKGTIQNPSWHNSASGKSWVFIDEVSVWE